MKNTIVACFDVYYYENYARACCIVFNRQDEMIISEYSERIEGVKEYVSGQFFKRELPCILKVLEKVKEDVGIIIIDSFIWVEGDENGLGAYLYEAINGRIPVIGVAKSYLKGSTAYLEVYRGESIKPLFVSAIGIDLNYSVEFIKGLSGEFRVPDMLKRVNQLSRKRLELRYGR